MCLIRWICIWWILFPLEFNFSTGIHNLIQSNRHISHESPFYLILAITPSTRVRIIFLLYLLKHHIFVICMQNTVRNTTFYSQKFNHIIEKFRATRHVIITSTRHSKLDLNEDLPYLLWFPGNSVCCRSLRLPGILFHRWLCMTSTPYLPVCRERDNSQSVKVPIVLYVLSNKRLKMLNLCENSFLFMENMNI